MKILLSTTVKGNPKSIMKRFGESLFKALAPPGIRLELIQFDGSKKGDKVHLKMFPLGISFLKQEWISVITEHGAKEDSAWFIDEGQQLPWFIRSWRHQHIVQKLNQTESIIIDYITYKSSFFLIAWLLYPVMLLQFYYRKPIYRRYFN